MKITTLFTLFVVLVLSSCSSEDLCDRTVTYQKAQAVYADLGDFRNVTLNNPARNLVTPGKIFVADDLLLIVEEETGIHVVDNSDPVDPKFINFIDVPGIREMAVEGTDIYVDSYYDILKIDISNPLQVRLTERIEEAFTIGVTNAEGDALVGFTYEQVTESVSCDSDIFNEQVVWFDFQNERIPRSALPTSFVSSGETFGTVNRMAIASDRLYIIGNSDLTIINTENARPTLEQTMNGFGWNMETIFPYEDHLFIGARQNMAIYSIQNPSAPSYEGDFFHANSCDPVLPTNNEVAYVTLRGAGECGGNENTLNIIDIRNLNNPTLLRAIEMDSPYAMSIHNNTLYVGQGTFGFSAFEIDNQELIHLYDNKDITAYDIIPHPTRSDILLFAGPTGIMQYEVEGDGQKLVSEILY